MKTTSQIKREQDGTIELTIVVPWLGIKQTKDEVIADHAKEADLAGFRKGMAPLDLVEKSLDKGHIREDILRKILPAAYADAVKTNAINPIVSPRVRVQKIEDEKDWEIVALTCEMPKIELGNYKEEVEKVTAKSKILIPGKERETVSFDEISKALLESVRLTVPKVILEQETERLLAQTLDEIKRLGLTLDQYLASTGKNIEALKADYAKKAESDIKIEFTLQQIASEQNIKVEESEIEEAIKAAKTDEERKNLTNNKYLVASIIRQQKTLDFLRNL
ncbi:MAG: hypothetical protein A2798_02690 [Candidatus Levybacteria bacterium RIFCSPHIGHO2_01_FULL_37_17]|nr:MAG: hypothetical protein A2798_02690 [Candidatus Levybacteria bacterium RIFCSPHIGHO2_01_FULL_37_17]OGH36764.1 MAG: hypothetical protein A2959_00680 [Candidatus Levybacteria bacterium RIFCSPLOWO2_01_FULL_38_23]